MRKYVIFGKYSSDFYTAMLNKPKNRLEFVKPILNTLNIELVEFLLTSGSNSNFVCIVKSENDEKIEALMSIVFASGNFSNYSWSRAFEADEQENIFKLGKEKMKDYVSAMQVAGTD